MASIPNLLVILLLLKKSLSGCIEFPDYCLNCNQQDNICKECESGTYVIYSGECRRCEPQCKECADIHYNCIACVDGYYVYKPENAFSNQCIPCKDKNCQKCDGNPDYYCIECIPGYFINNEGICEPCHNSCSKCTGPLESQCTQCNDGYFNPSQSDGQKEFSCVSCVQPHCKTCSGQGEADCIECKDKYYKSGNLCRSCDTECQTCKEVNNYCTSCPDGFYLVDSHCEKCADNCKTCTGPYMYECTSCMENYVLYNGQCSTCEYASQGKCSKCKINLKKKVVCLECQEGYRINEEDYDYDDETIECESCYVYNCADCQEDRNSCKKCKSNYFLESEKQCSSCEPPCLNCEGSANTCTSCIGKYFLDKSTSTCKPCPANCTYCDSGDYCSICDNNFYPVNGECQKCDESCELCHDNTNACDECKRGYYYNQFNRCVKCSDNCLDCNSTTCKLCANEFYPDNFLCLPCAEVCSQCTGPTVDDCSYCDPGYFFSGGVCFKCDDSCKTCYSSSDTSCYECATGYYLDRNAIDPNWGGRTSRCLKCEYNCKNCSGIYSCTDCQDGYRLYFRDGEENSGDCQPCKNRGCKKCDDGIDKCTECIDGYYKSSTDNSGFVTCSKCPENCKTCQSGQSQTPTCTECNDGYYSHQGNCLSCDPKCNKCTDSHTCLSCVDGYLFDGVSCNTRCSADCLSCAGKADTCTSCPYGYVLRGSKCSDCGEGCRTCNVYNDFIYCSSCIDGFYYKNEQCHKCHETCKTCNDNHEAACTSCAPGYFFSSADYQPNKEYTGICSSCDGEGHEHCELCVQDCNEEDSTCNPIPICTKCSDGWYVNDNNLCDKCHDSCAACDGPGLDHCITCAEGLLFHENICTSCDSSCLTCDKTPTNCTSCSSGKYLNKNKCDSCDKSCTECQGESTYCTKCPDNKYSYKGKCYSTCYDVNEIVGANITTKECYQCTLLDHCLEYDDACQCLSCEDGYYVARDPVTRIEFCLPCQLENCKKCNGDQRNDCIECNAGYYLETIQNTGAKICNTCASPCANCTGPTNTSCTGCIEGYVLNGTVCDVLPNDCISNKHCEADNSDGKEYLNYTADLPSYDDFHNEKSGGAIRLINYGLTAENSAFNNCASENGGGGGIFVFNNINDNKAKYEITLKNVTFNGCKAHFGAAVYIYSPSEESPVIIENCKFIANQLYQSSTGSNSKLSGGSALYLTVKNGNIDKCTFDRNIGIGLIKLSEEFDQLPESRLLQSHENRTTGFLSIRRCIFDNAECSLFFENEKQMTRIEINDCTFKGKLPVGAHFIDGRGKQNPNIFIKSCVFESNEDKALSSRIISIDLRNQLLALNSFSKKNKLPSNSFLIFPTIGVAILAVATITVMKRRQDNDIDDQNESLQA